MAVGLLYGGRAVLVVRILSWTRSFCNIHLVRVPRSWTGSVQMKSSMTFIRGNMCIEKEKDNFKNGREVKRLKERALSLTSLKRREANQTQCKMTKINCIFDTSFASIAVASMNKTNHPMLSNSHPFATANKAWHCLKWGGVTKPSGTSYIIFTEYKRVQQTGVSEDYSPSVMILILIKSHTVCFSS